MNKLMCFQCFLSDLIKDRKGVYICGVDKKEKLENHYCEYVKVKNNVVL